MTFKDGRPAKICEYEEGEIVDEFEQRLIEERRESDAAERRLDREAEDAQAAKKSKKVTK